MDINKARELFPYLMHGKIYFNHASTGPLCSPVLENIAKVLYEKSETNIDEYLGLQAVIKETKADLGDLINTKPDRIAFLDNTSNGINVLATGLKWKKGNRIVLNDLEFPANVYPFLNLKKLGVEVDLVKSHNGIVTADDVIEMIKPETKLVSISHVQFLTGYRVDLEKIGKVCKEKGIIFSVDAIQGLGAVRLDVVRDNIDFISAGSQKWLLGLQGLSFIYVSEKLQQKIEQDYVGWLSVDDSWNFLNYELKLKSSADRFQGGTLNSIGIYALNASLKFFKLFGFDEIEKLVTTNSSYLIQKLEEIGIKLVLSGCDKKNIAGIVSFKHDNSQKIFEALSQKKIHCAVRSGYVRFSPHFYNTKDETDIVVEELRRSI
ncbi:MAG: aminotransferase class V-fold PLP-dependent enzyme [Bacteroidetes bacterium]|nr:aminotransferase class V-fold PLP-dependent enzyme [Bacteroidota bacterium]